MKNLLILFMVLGSFASYANGCHEAKALSMRLEALVKGVDYITESDSDWSAFSSKIALEEVTDIGIKRVLGLDDIKGSDEPFYKVQPHKEAYDFLNSQIEAYSKNGVYEDIESSLKLKKLISIILERFDAKVRLVMHGEGNEYSYFVGNHMIVLIMDSGCVLGLKAYTVWT